MRSYSNEVSAKFERGRTGVSEIIKNVINNEKVQTIQEMYCVLGAVRINGGVIGK